jgi:hypothetical protein
MTSLLKTRAIQSIHFRRKNDDIDDYLHPDALNWVEDSLSQNYDRIELVMAKIHVPRLVILVWL